jgi:UDP-2,3-diacylglucosamine hydrolase
LRERAPAAEALYLLGDIFEVWVGDDDTDPMMAAVAKALAELVNRGVAVYFMHGNRDFLVRSRYAERCGFTLLEDPCVRSIGGIRTLLSHGDIYCTDDLAYQAFRAKSRTPEWQRKILSMPLFVRKLIARYGRAKSKRHYKKYGAINISDLVSTEFIPAMEAAGVKRFIHGHTHRPDVHSVSLENGRGERIVLADWRELGEALEVLPNGSYQRIVLA